MPTAMPLDLVAIARVCEAHGVQRLSVFGSILTDQFDTTRSDVDFLVDFASTRPNVFHDYFDLKDELEHVVGRRVDLVMADAVKNPYLAKSIFESAEIVFAA